MVLKEMLMCTKATRILNNSTVPFIGISKCAAAMMVLTTIFLSGCSSKVDFVKHASGSRSKVEEIKKSIGSKEKAASILQKAIRSSEYIFYNGEMVSHKGFLGPKSIPPNPSPDSPASIATVSVDGISTSWDLQQKTHVSTMPTHDGHVYSYRLDPVKRNPIYIPFPKYCEIYYAQYVSNSNFPQEVLDSSTLYSSRDGLWFFMRPAGSRQPPTKFNAFTFGLFVNYKFYSRQPGGIWNLFRSLPSKDQPDYRKLDTILACFDLLCGQSTEE
jgi:hypothetical protein